MSDEIEFGRLLATVVVSDLGDRAPDWEVESAEYHRSDVMVFGLPNDPQVRVALRSVSGKYESVGVYFTEGGTSLAYSIVAVADGIQDHAVEATDGEPLPPCPGHRHPLSAQVIDGLPKWVCMKEGAAYYARDILPGFRADDTVAAYLRRHQPSAG